MSIEVMRKLAWRIGEHVETTKLSFFNIVLHGGEPLLGGVDPIELLVRETRREISERVQDKCRLYVSMQTNGTRLTEEFLDQLAALDVSIGISLDGGKDDNDRSRVDLAGKGTFDRVSKGIERLQTPQYHHLFRTLLCYVDIRNDPIATYNALADFNPPQIDFLLPLANWTNPPRGLVPGSGTTPYADWLIAADQQFLTRLLSGQPAPRIRYMSHIMNLAKGEREITSEVIGEAVRGALVVNTAGEFESLDALNTVEDGFAPLRWRTTNPDLKQGRLKRGARLSIFTVPILDADTTQMEMNASNGVKRLFADESPVLCPTCRACSLLKKCEGGYYPHRYKEDSMFWNPSVYCDDIKKLFAYADSILIGAQIAEREHI